MTEEEIKGSIKLAIKSYYKDRIPDRLYRVTGYACKYGGSVAVCNVFVDGEESAPDRIPTENEMQTFTSFSLMMEYEWKTDDAGVEWREEKCH